MEDVLLDNIVEDNLQIKTFFLYKQYIGWLDWLLLGIKPTYTYKITFRKIKGNKDIQRTKLIDAYIKPQDFTKSEIYKKELDLIRSDTKWNWK